MWQVSIETFCPLFNTLAEFSRAHCISICAFFVPANLVATTLTIILTTLSRPQFQVLQAAGIASILALVMILHVFTISLVARDRRPRKQVLSCNSASQVYSAMCSQELAAP